MNIAAYKKFRWIPTLLVTLAILWLTLAPHPLPSNKLHLFRGADKVVHAIMFCALTFAALFDISRWTFKMKLRTMFLTAFVVLIFAYLDEAAQTHMKLGRRGDLYDFIADAVGIFLATWLIMLCYYRKKQ